MDAVVGIGTGTGTGTVGTGTISTGWPCPAGINEGVAAGGMDPSHIQTGSAAVVVKSQEQKAESFVTI